MFQSTGARSDNGTFIIVWITTGTPPIFRPNTKGEHALATKDTIEHHLKGLQTEWKNFALQSMQTLTIANLPTAKAVFTGIAEGAPQTTTNYVLMPGSNLVNIMIDARGPENAVAVEAARRAVESAWTQPAYPAPIDR
jgi:hypothetical protein